MKTWVDHRTAKDPEAFVADLNRAFVARGQDLVASIEAIGDITPSGRRRIVVRFTEGHDEHCPQCGGPVERVVINGHDSWACPKDASAWSVDQDEEYYE